MPQMTFVDMRTVAPRRQGRRRPSGRGAGIVAAVVAALLLVTVGIVLGRASVPDSSPRIGGTPSRDAAETAVGPQNVIDGVGIAWRQDRDGAIAAATAYLVGINSRAYVADATKRRRILTAIAVPDQRAALAQRAGTVVRPEAAGDPFAAAFALPKSSAWRLVPLGYRVVSHEKDAAVISIWAVQVAAGVGGANVPATARWSTTTLPLRWAEDDWKLDLTLAHSVQGPSPGLSPGPQSSDLDVIAVDGSYEEYAHGAR
jgi:hypothetical protein